MPEFVCNVVLHDKNIGHVDKTVAFAIANFKRDMEWSDSAGLETTYTMENGALQIGVVINELPEPRGYFYQHFSHQYGRLLNEHSKRYGRGQEQELNQRLAGLIISGIDPDEPVAAVWTVGAVQLIAMFNEGTVQMQGRMTKEVPSGKDWREFKSGMAALAAEIERDLGVVRRSFEAAMGYHEDTSEVRERISSGLFETERWEMSR